MKTHVVRSGDCLATIADRYGFHKWQTLYEHPSNADFRKKRPNPNVIHPGDVINIPDLREKDYDRGEEEKHTFKIERSRWMFRLQILDEWDQPMDDMDFDLFVDGELLLEGRTDADGLIECKLPDNSKSGKLVIAGMTFPLNLGNLDPITTLSGIQARLNNMGYNAGPVDGIYGPKTRAGILAFQHDYELDETGEPDKPTRDKLIELHDNDACDGELEDPYDVLKEEPPVSSPQSGTGDENHEWVALDGDADDADEEESYA